MVLYILSLYNKDSKGLLRKILHIKNVFDLSSFKTIDKFLLYEEKLLVFPSSFVSSLLYSFFSSK